MGFFFFFYIRRRTYNLRTSATAAANTVSRKRNIMTFEYFINDNLSGGKKKIVRSEKYIRLVNAFMIIAR